MRIIFNCFKNDEEKIEKNGFKTTLNCINSLNARKNLLYIVYKMLLPLHVTQNMFFASVCTLWASEQTKESNHSQSCMSSPSSSFNHNLNSINLHFISILSALVLLENVSISMEQINTIFYLALWQFKISFGILPIFI